MRFDEKKAMEMYRTTNPKKKPIFKQLKKVFLN
jgi:hypothetical protein